jgi:hypothetical protein
MDAWQMRNRVRDSVPLQPAAQIKTGAGEPTPANYSDNNYFFLAAFFLATFFFAFFFAAIIVSLKLT